MEYERSRLARESQMRAALSNAVQNWSGGGGAGDAQVGKVMMTGAGIGACLGVVVGAVLGFKSNGFAMLIGGAIFGGAAGSLTGSTLAFAGLIVVGACSLVLSLLLRLTRVARRLL